MSEKVDWTRMADDAAEEMTAAARRLCERARYEAYNHGETPLVADLRDVAARLEMAARLVRGALAARLQADLDQAREGSAQLFRAVLGGVFCGPGGDAGKKKEE